MRRALSIGIVAFWLILLGMLVRRTWRPPAATPGSDEPLADAAQGPAESDEWMGVFHGAEKVGYTHQAMSATGEGFSFSEVTLLRLTLMDAPQTVRTRLHGHVGKDYSLQDVDFELSSGVANLSAHAVADAGQLRLTLHTAHDTSEQVLPLPERVYLPSSLRASVRGGTLAPGKRLDALIFDPTTLSNDHMQLTVVGREAVPQTAPTVEAWRVEEQFRSLKTTAWVDAAGVVLREEGPMGLVLVRQTPDQAVNEGWKAQSALDVMASTAVPVERPIDDARHRVRLRVRLTGIDVNRVPSDDEQRREGATLTITRPAIAAIGSYPLPYAGGVLAADLAPTAFLQSTHPRVQAAAHAAVGDEHDAKRAVNALNDWVYAHLRKVPTVSIPNAIQVLDMGEGDCNEHAVLFAALARAVGVPARIVAGAVYLDGAFYYHAWCEVWLSRWVSVDPTFHQFPADATHIKFIVGGPDEQLGMMEVVGRLGVEVLDDDDGHAG